MKRLLLTVLLFSTCALSFSVKGQWYAELTPKAELNFGTWFDNREYKSDYAPDMTLFGAKLTPLVGLQWDKHRLMTGVDLRVDFGDKQFDQDPEFILYYNYKHSGFEAYAGIFPRSKLRGGYSRAFMSDSTCYYDSNLEGFMLSYSGKRGYAEVAMDWLSRIGEERREKFVLFSSGILHTNNRKWFLGYDASMFHHSISYTDDGVTDNILAYPFVERAFVSHRWFSNVWARAGWLQAMQRIRKESSKFKTPGGVQAEVYLATKCGAGLFNTIYIGDNLMPYYDRFGNGLYQGDSFYRKTGDVYNRLELFWKIPYKSYMNFKVASVHHYDGNKWNWQQTAVLSIYLNDRTARFRK